MRGSKNVKFYQLSEFIERCFIREIPLHRVLPSTYYGVHRRDLKTSFSGWTCSSILVLLESCLQTCMTYTIAECTLNKLLMMNRGTVRNILHFVDRASCKDSWWMTDVTHKFSSMCLFLFITLYMFRAHSAHHQERKIVSIQPLVTIILCWLFFFQPANISASNTEWLLPEAVLKQFVSPDDEHCVLETCREL